MNTTARHSRWLRLEGLPRMLVLIVAAQCHGAPATLPANDPLTWGKEPIEAKTSQRATICLNGIWQAMPALNEARQQPTADWGYIRVPGGWQDSSGQKMPGLIAAGTGSPWQDVQMSQVSRVWYQRPIQVPADWAGRLVLLEFDRISTDARVFVNDRDCGQVHFPDGLVDITRAVTPGKEATLRVLVVAAENALAVESLLAGNEPASEGQPQPGGRRHRDSSLAARGLVGDVLLCSRPAGAHIDSIYVKTSTRQKQLALEVELAGVTQGGNVHFTAVALYEQGREERRFETNLTVRADQRQIAQPVWSWPNPRLWDLGQPNLYTLVVKVQGAGLDDEMRQTFGFREFWVDGPKYFLNGKEMRMRPVMGHPDKVRGAAEEIDGHIDAFKGAGYNLQEIWPTTINIRGHPDDYLVWYQRADLKGWPIIGVLDDIQGYEATWRDPQTREQFRAEVASQIKGYRNHPSIVMWTTSPNYAHGDETPRIVGNNAAGWNKLGAWTATRFPKLQEGIEIIRGIDGTRPVISHHSGCVGDVYTLNMYLDFIPLQEREEWLSYWAAYGDVPYFIVEFGSPLQPSYHRGRHGFDDSINTEPLDAEFCSIYLGNRAYAEETPQYRALIRSTFKGGQAYARWQDYPEEIFCDSVQQIQELFVRNTWRSWRTMGNIGGMFPWSNAHGWAPSADGDKEVDLGPFVPGRRGYYFHTASVASLHWLEAGAAQVLPAGKALLENNQPTLAWICGPDGRPNPGVPGPDRAFTAKDHNFWTGRTIDKQVAVLNDTRLPQKYSIQWEATVAGRRVGSGKRQGTIDQAQTLFEPISFNAPERIDGSRVDGQIKMTAKVGEATHQDQFPFRVFAPPARFSGELAVYDPARSTTRLLRRLGYSVHQWDQVTFEPVIAIGRSALMGRPDLLHELEPFVQNGARVVVFVQDPEFLRNRLGLRVAWHMSRRVFPVSASHPVVAGLEAADLSDWAGSSTLLEPYPNGTWEKAFPFDWEPGAAAYGWRWGGRGAVASASVEKPHKGSWQPILEDEFDLAYSPLMELDYGKGLLLWCMLDLEDHADKDPAALQLAGQIVQYARMAPLTPKARKTLYVGDEAGAKLLDDLGLVYDKATAISADADLVVAGLDNGLSDEALNAFVQGGGKVLVLPRSGESLPLGGRQKKVDNFAGSLKVPNWPEARGLSESDLRWRTDSEAWLIASGGEVGADGLLARKTLGKGVLLYCQLDPNRFDADNKTYFRFTRWRQTRALCQVLSNLGGQFSADKLVFTAIPESAAKEPWKFEPIKQPSAFYSMDYRDDFALGDDPYRYYNW